jgi:hypothetical protein
MARTDHPILPRPWECEIVELKVVVRDVPSVDIVFERLGIQHRLRFLRPRGVRFEEGHRGAGGGFAMSDLRIFDVSEDGLEDLRVHVLCDGSSPGTLELWAEDVVELGR